MSKTARSISLDDEDWQIVEAYGRAFGQSRSDAITSIVRQPKIYIDWIDIQKPKAANVTRR